jgi:protein MPE1
MASYVYFKFKSQKEPQRVTIDGPHTDVWNLKREIMSISRLGDGTDIDLKIYKEDGEDGKSRCQCNSIRTSNNLAEYTDDTEIIPKDSTVLARRLPASAPGKGRAARYVSGKPPVSARLTAASGKPAAQVELTANMTEKERLEAMFKFTDAQWRQKQEEMANEKKVDFQGTKPRQKANVPEGEPPHGYICYRCGKKGHWIQACPTNDDSSYDNKNRIKRTTGIPRSMLKKIEQEDIDKLDDQQRQHLMVNAEGEYVFAQADEKTWKKHLEQVNASEASKRNAAEDNKEIVERGLACPIDSRLFVDPMKTPCCGKTYCHDCIENALLDNDLTCPGCETQNISLEALVPDEDVKANIKAYQEEKTNDKQRSRSPTASVATPKPDEAAGSDSRPVTRDGSKTPVSENGQGKKRSADEANETCNGNLEVPAMKRQKSGEGTPAPAETKDANTPADSTEQSDAKTTDFPVDMMPPDFSQMNMPNMGMNFPMMPNNMMGMGMPMGMNMMPNMNMGMMGMMPGMNMNMMGNMMGGMPNMNGMNGMTGIGNFNGMNSMNGMNGMNPSNQFNNNNNHRGNSQNNKNHQFRNKRGGGFNNHAGGPPAQQMPPKQPEGLSNVPTGPKAMKPNGASNNGGYPPSGPAGGKFANQQRFNGPETANAYQRAPVNAQRGGWKNKRGKAREADYREL